ncbi:hypothetical protein E9993_00110 [Labilibacter sediminis]|nr:hypothetical protein E9993_00110 [Labilibacter sediminis]
MKYLIMIALGLFLSTIGLYSQSYKVIVNKGNQSTSITSKEVSSYFLKKKTKWGNGQKVSPVELKANSSVRVDFSKGVHKKSVGAVKSYWQQAIFSGKGTPPVEKKSDIEIIEYVKSHSGAIGYVSSGCDVSEVKVIKIIE